MWMCRKRIGDCPKAAVRRACAPPARNTLIPLHPAVFLENPKSRRVRRAAKRGGMGPVGRSLRAGFFVLISLWAFGLPQPVFSPGRNGAAAAAVDDDRAKKEGNVTQRTELNEEEGKYLLEVARKTIDDALNEREETGPSETGLPEIYKTPRGTFVTLTISGGLRGCIGHIIPRESLIEGIRVNAINAAFRDPRFRPLTQREWNDVRIEISILTEPQRLDYSGGDDLVNKLRPGIDGVIIKKGYRQSTFLPQVWEQLPRTEEFLEHLCLKAGLPGDAWRKGDLEVSTYQVQAFEEH